MMRTALAIWTAGLILALLSPAAQALPLLLTPWRAQSGDDPAWARPDFDDREWPEQSLPWLLDARHAPHRGWYRVRFDLPAQRPDSGWAVHLGRIRTADEVFLNGQRIGGEGRIDRNFEDALQKERTYVLPEKALRNKGNVLAVRVQSSMAKGGIAGEAHLGEREALLGAALRRALRQKQREALVIGLLGTTLLFWLLLHRRGKEDSDYRLLGLLLSLLAGTFVLESLWFHDSPWSSPATQRLSIGLFILLPLPIFQLGRAWSESLLPRRLLGGLSAASLLLAAAWLAIGGVSLCQWVEPVWFGMILIGGGVILLECLRIRKRLRDPIAASVLAGLMWLGVLGTAEYAMGIWMPARLPFSLLLHSGFAGLVLALAVALALRYRRTNRQLRRLSQQIVATQEAERKRLAADLHNDIAPTLATIKLDLQLYFRKHGQDNEGRPTIDTLAHAIEEIRTLSHELRPAVVDQLGLTAALRGLAERLARRHGWTLDLDLPDAFAHLSADIAVSLYRMAQEALYNAARHAEARTVGLSLRSRRHGIELRVTDDGRGCNPGITGSGGGIGWLTLRERAAALGGTCRIRSQPGHGLEITLWIPLN